jgi:hypothetical protein
MSSSSQFGGSQLAARNSSVGWATHEEVVDEIEDVERIDCAIAIRIA